jgi:predicted dehydrogenase
MPPFNVDPKSLISIQQQLCCYCYPIGFLPTYVKLKRYLTEEQINIGEIQSIECRIRCCSLKSSSDDRINSSLLNRFGSFALSILFYLFGTQQLSTISHAYIQSPHETTCSFHINYNRLLHLPPIFVNIISNSHISSSYNQELIIITSKCALIVNDYRLILRRLNIDDQLLVDSFHSDTNERFSRFAIENPEIPLLFIQSFYYFIGHLKESLINQIPRSTFTELTSFDIVYKVQEAIIAIREAARTGEIVPIVRLTFSLLYIFFV